MENSFLFQVFSGIQPEEYRRLRKFLQSPYFNQRSDVLLLFDWLVRQQQSGNANRSPESAFAAICPGQPYKADVLHLTSRYLLDLIEQYLACESWRSDDQYYRLSLLRALRHRKLGAHFERHAQRAEQQHRNRPERHAGYHLMEYQVQSEIFEYRIVTQRNWQANLSAIVDSLGQFFVLENLRWSGMIGALRLRSGADLEEPLLAAAVQAYAAQPDQSLAVTLQFNSSKIMAEPENEAAFEALCQILPQGAGLFPPSQHRDLYMTAINFCIRRQNKGDRSYTQKALQLYRQALSAGVLLENGTLPKYTYHNINALAHLAGEGNWAEAFLAENRDLLEPSIRENIYRYNLAICCFRKGDYSATMHLLRDVETSDVFEQLDIRRMLLRAYYALQEWQALAPLLDSFKAILLRKKGLGYHRESYLNLVRFTQKLLKIRLSGKSKKNALAERIKQTQQVAEREWLLAQLA